MADSLTTLRQFRRLVDRFYNRRRLVGAVEVATLLSDVGEPLRTAQAQLGHASLSATAEIYVQAVPASQRAAIEKLERTVVCWWTEVDKSSRWLKRGAC